MTIDNAAGRLHRILTIAASVQNAQQVMTRTVLLNALEADPNDESDFLERLGYLLRLPNQTREAVGSLEGINQRKYFDPIREVEIAFIQLHLNDNWDRTQSMISPHTLAMLDACSDLLSSRAAEASLDEEQLLDLRSSLAGALESALAEDGLQDAIRDYIVRSLHRLLEALDRYPIVGISAVQDALDRSLGEGVRSGAIKAADHKNHTVGKFLLVLAVVADLITLSGASIPDMIDGVGDIVPIHAVQAPAGEPTSHPPATEEVLGQQP